MPVHLEECHNRTINKTLLLKFTQASNNKMKINVKCSEIESYAANNLKIIVAYNKIIDTYKSNTNLKK